MRLSFKSLLILTGSILALRFLSLGIYELFDTTESRYAAIGMRMALTGDFITPQYFAHKAFLGKAPLSFWATALSFKAFGINEFAARLPHFLAFLLNLYIIYKAIESKGKYNALLTATIFSSFTLSFIIMGSVMTESFLILGTNMIILSFYKTCIEKSPSLLWKYGFFIGVTIAALGKGPAGVIIAGIPIFFFALIRRRFKDLFLLPMFSGTILMLILVLPWYILCQIQNPDFLEYFIYGEHIQRFINPHWMGDRYGSPHAEPMFMIWLFLAASIFLWLFYIIYAAVQSLKQKQQVLRKPLSDVDFFFVLAFLCPLLFFSFARNIIITYSAFALMPLAYLLARMLESHAIKAKTFITICITPAILITFGLLLNHYLHISKDSHKYIIQTFNAQKGEESSLIYYHTNNFEYSAQFYGKDQITIVENVADLKRALLKHDNFFVIEDADISSLSFKDSGISKKLEKLICAPINKHVCLYKTIK